MTKHEKKSMCKLSTMKVDEESNNYWKGKGFMSTELTKTYRNLFEEAGIDPALVKQRLEEVKQTFFYGADDERVYFPVGEDMGYITDTGNDDVRTEGMSYGMMMCVQLDMKEEFDRLWKWSKTYMWMDEGFNEGYFAWSCQLDGTKNANGPAPDGEEFFALALFFAAHRWGNGEGIFDYTSQAKDILRACIHKGQNGRIGTPMWNHDNHQILFVPGADFTDPSYHLPHFYELFAQWADEEDREFWKKAVKASRDYLAVACHPVTGFSAEYAEFDGSPMSRPLPWTKDRHDWFYSDAYRTVANIGLDYEWYGVDAGQRIAAERIQEYLLQARAKEEYYIYEIDGSVVEGSKAHHPLAIPATVAQSALAIPKGDTKAYETALGWVKAFWDMPLRTGKYRYYDNCLYMFAFLALSGNYRIWR